MRIQRFFLVLVLIAAWLTSSAARADLNYRAEITGAEDSDLADLLDKVSELKTLEDKPPASEEALRRRAERGRCRRRPRTLRRVDTRWRPSRTSSARSCSPRRTARRSS